MGFFSLLRDEGEGRHKCFWKTMHRILDRCSTLDLGACAVCTYRRFVAVGKNLRALFPQSFRIERSQRVFARVGPKADPLVGIRNFTDSLSIKSKAPDGAGA